MTETVTAQLESARCITTPFLANAKATPDRTIYTFIDADARERSMTFGEVDRCARRIAQRLRAIGAPGDRVVLAYDSSLELVTAVWGILYAGMVLVPLDPVGPGAPEGNLERLEVALVDAGATIGIAPPDALARVREVPNPGGAVWTTIDLDELLASPMDPSFLPFEASLDDLAFIQYTSGSSGAPKGTVVRHGMIVRLARSSYARRRSAPASSTPDVFVNWLPMAHSVMLHGLVFRRLWGETIDCFLTPASFMQSPLRWLRAIASRDLAHKVSATAPNFAFDLCVASTTEEERSALDLRRWIQVLNVAERIRPETWRRFRAGFEPSGFAAPQMISLYGSTETGPVALAVNGRAGRFDPRAFADEARLTPSEGGMELQSCGPPVEGVDLFIVDPGSGEALANGRIGEIWVRSATLAGSYWNHDEGASSAFQARTSTGEGPCFRTGDLGALFDGELFITGRLKSMLIVRGMKHYAEDIEEAACSGVAWLERDCAMALAVDTRGDEELVVVVEVPASLDAFEAKAEELRGIIARRFGVRINEVLFVANGRLPRTSVGKLARATCKRRIEAGELEVLERFGGAMSAESIVDPAALLREIGPSDWSRKLPDALRRVLSGFLGVAPEELGLSKTFADLGVDSATGIRFRATLVKALGRELPISVLFAHPTINALAAHLSFDGEDEAREDPHDSEPSDDEDERALLEQLARMDALREGSDSLPPPSQPPLSRRSAIPPVTRESVREEQRSALDELRRFVYASSPFYRSFHEGLFDRPLEELPILTKPMLMEHFDDLVTDPLIRRRDVEAHLAAVASGMNFLGRYVITASSGTTGQRGLFVFESSEWSRLLETYLRPSAWSGLVSGQTTQPRLAFTSSAPWHQSAQVADSLYPLERSVLVLETTDPIERIVARLNEHQPDFFGTYPSLARPLADEQLAGRLRIAPKMVSLGGEVLTADARARMESAWGRVTHQNYATTETGVLAAECEQQRGLHVLEDVCIVEVVDESGAPVPPGVLGARVLVTVLFRRAQPLIRYEISDRIRLTEDTCSCGRPFRMIKAVEGRVEEKLIFEKLDGSGEVAMDTFIFENVLDRVSASGWQVVQDQESIAIVLARPGRDVRDEHILEPLRRELAASGVEAPEMKVVRVDAIPRGATGKAPVFLVRRRLRER